MNRDNNINNRIVLLLMIFVVVAIAILGKLFILQIINHKEYTIRALEQINKAETINSSRGKILDSNGKNLAINESASTLVVNPVEIEDKEYIISILSSKVGISKRKLADMLATEKEVKVAQWMPREIANEIRSMNLKGVRVSDGIKRYYPVESLSHVIGFVNMENEGQYGIESSYNKELKGVPGRIYKSSDSTNQQIPTGDRETVRPTDGESLILTIDEQIQRFAYEESIKIKEEFDAVRTQIIVQETKTGDILAISSYPSYDNNNPRDPMDSIQERMWRDPDEMEKGWYNNWTNPVIAHNYEPGSTFKLITAALSLEENTSNPDEQHYCTGYIRDIKNAPILRCVSHDDPHGDITLKEGLAKSCNPTFVYAARELGKESFLKGIRDFGFGDRTGIDLPGESSGIIPGSFESMSDLDLATISYGHGIAVTPIQLINAVSAIGNDGFLMTPRIVKEKINVDGSVSVINPVAQKRQVISKSTAHTIQEMMSYAVENGIASRAKSSLYNIGGKTGTANKVSEKGGYIEGEYISSFIGMAPMENPEITVLVVVDSPKKETFGSLVAAPHAKNIIEKTLDYKGIPYNTDTGDDTLVEVPDIRYNILGQGGSLLTELGLKYITDYTDLTEGTIITKQRPRPGDKVKPGSIVELTVDNNEDKKIVPSLIGLGVDDVVSVAEILDIDILVEGTGVVVEQDPTPGKKLRTVEKISIMLEEDEETTEDNKYRDDVPKDMTDIDSETTDDKNSEEEN